MGRSRKTDTPLRSTVAPPAMTEEGRESRLVSLAYDLVEQRLRDGTATSAETTAILRLGTSRARLEKEKLEQEVRLAAAKTSAIESNKHVEEMMEQALKAFRSYSGNDEEGDDNFEEIF